MLFPSLFSIEEAAKKKRDKETDPEPISSSSSFHLKEEILLQERPSKKDEFSSTHKDRSDGEEDMGLFSPSSSFSLDCLCDLYERQQRIREKEKQDERRERKRTIDQEGGGRLNPWRTRQQEEEEEEEEKGEAVLLNQLKRGLIKLEDLSHTFSSSLVRHLGVYTLPVLFLSSGVFGSIVAFFTFKRRMKSLSSMGVSRQAEPHLLFSHLPPRPQENPCSNTLFSSSSLPSSISPSSSSSSSSFSILAEEMKKNRRKRGDPCQSMFDDEEEEEAEDSNSLIKQNRQGNPSSPSSSSSIEVLSFHEIAKLFLLPASSLFLLFGSVWLYLKYSCRFHNVDDFLETLRWLRGTGPAPLLFNSSSSSSLPDQRKKVFLPAADTTSST